MTVLTDYFRGADVELRDEQEPCPACETPMRVVVLTVDGWWGLRVISHSRAHLQRCTGDCITIRKGQIE